MDISWFNSFRQFWETRSGAIIITGAVTSAVAYGIYKLFWSFWQNKEEADEYFEKVENSTAADLPKIRVLVVGLDGSGKTSFVQCLGKDKKENVMPRPTMGFNIKSITIGSTTFDIWDVGGSELCRAYWKEFAKDINVIVYVVDSSDESRFKESSEALKDFLQNDVTFDIPIVFVANKQDRDNAKSPKEVVKHIMVDTFIQKSRQYTVTGVQISPGGARKGIWAAYQNIIKLSSN